MELLVYSWSEVDNRVRIKYLTLIMFGHGKVPDVLTEIPKSLEKLAIPLKLMVSLRMDGANVNKAILNKINEIKKEKGYQQLVKCPPRCLVHVCHNSFKKGIAKYGYNAEELCLNCYYFFKRSSCQQQDIFEIEESLGLEELILLHHVQSHWLSLIPALGQLVKIK